MKGVVFTVLADMVEEMYSLTTWDAILEQAGSDGLYVSTETYADSDLNDLLVAAEAVTGEPVAHLVRTFGKFSFPRFHAQIPHLQRDDMTFLEFLQTVDRVIHVEVRKLNPDASLPQFDCESSNDDELVMYYSSPRRLCMLAEGLIAGAADHFGTEFEMTHDECMHHGADRCRMVIRLKAQSLAA